MTPNQHENKIKLAAPSQSDAYVDLDVGVEDKSTSTSRHEDASEEQQLASKETRAVFRLRIVVFLALFLAASLVSVVVFKITRESEKEDFETTFEGASAKLVESFEEIVQQKIGAVTSLSVAFTSYARSNNDTWPFVTMNDFQQQAASARSLSNSLFLELLVSHVKQAVSLHTHFLTSPTHTSPHVCLSSACDYR